MKHDKHPIVIVKKRKHKGHEGSHGSWKIAYADFMTAMMAFFLVMWLISISSPKELTQIAEYFRTPLAQAITGGQRIADSSSPIPGGGDDITQKQGEVKKEPNIDELKKKMERSRLLKLKGDLDQLIDADPKLKAMRPHLKIDLVQEGLRIQIIDSQNRPMFKRGSAEVEPYMRDILRGIAPILNSIPNKISISGHTDDIPYAQGERGYSNWELSADRANASRRELVVGGLDEGKVLRVVGMAATMRLPGSTAGDAMNRRISLLVLNKQTEQSILHENAESQSAPVSVLKEQETPPQEQATPEAGPASQNAAPTTPGEATPVTPPGMQGNTSPQGAATQPVASGQAPIPAEAPAPTGPTTAVPAANSIPPQSGTR
ncbi:flagellar motor protein MotB [Mangrovibacter yixingensis]|uniref:flagellar motor protein MotB n=1 Tax=Mangrovibacter yixingensis TaxID=1529639 RepID=UPI0038502FF8